MNLNRNIENKLPFTDIKLSRCAFIDEKCVNKQSTLGPQSGLRSKIGIE
jgi:hypothetical protein